MTNTKTLICFGGPRDGKEEVLLKNCKAVATNMDKVLYLVRGLWVDTPTGQEWREVLVFAPLLQAKPGRPRRRPHPEILARNTLPHPDEDCAGK